MNINCRYKLFSPFREGGRSRVEPHVVVELSGCAERRVVLLDKTVTPSCILWRREILVCETHRLTMAILRASIAESKRERYAHKTATEPGSIGRIVFVPGCSCSLHIQTTSKRIADRLDTFSIAAEN